MNKNLKNALKTAFEPPKPAGKRAFLRALPAPSMGTPAFLLAQAGYVRKWVWVLSGALFAGALAGTQWLERDVLWWLSACMPLLALSVLTESGRSQRWGMAEFELSTRFSLKSVVLARLLILGAANGALFCLLVPFAAKSSGVGLAQTAACMACPYLLTAFGGLWAVRRVRGREGDFLCAGIAAAVCAGSTFLHQSFPAAYEAPALAWWLAALALLGLGTTKQCWQMVKQTEELAWS
ncbi:MAG: hypothetical protein Q4F17_09010 [Eubacteriales bacterium]|nr:hypothetical protein [Eubacteriales bacterium]